MSELPLPWFSSGADPGPSFSELLKRVAPDAPVFNMTGGSLKDLEIPHGTTVVCIRYATGVIMAGDRRATEGYAIASRRIEKVSPADHWSGVSIAGAAGPAMEMVRLLQTELEHYEKTEGVALSLEGKANKLSQMIRANLPMAMQGLVVVPLFAGYDLRRNEGRVFKYDVTGGKYEEVDFAVSGSGSVHARNWIKGGWRADIEESDAVNLAILSLIQAADEDAATGGPDIIRQIFPSVATINLNGFAYLTHDDVAARATEILARTPLP